MDWNLDGKLNNIANQQPVQGDLLSVPVCYLI